jgi:type 1 glutamine amidotransferase
MVVAARTDPHAVHDDAYHAHPEWIAVDAEGKPRRHWADPDYWVTCALGPYNFEFMTTVTREIVELYKVDGVFSNRWAGSGMCYCESCKRLFRAASGFGLPRTTDPHDPAKRAHIEWREARLFECWRLWDAEVRKINPTARFIANSGGGALSDLDMKTAGAMADFLAADRQARRGLTLPWAAGKNGKEYRATMGSKPVAGLFSVGVEEPYRWKDSVQTDAELRIWSADATANGMRPWFVKFAATLRDRRWLKPVETIYDWHYRNERYLRNVRPLARVAMVYSQQTAKVYGGERARQKVEDHELGFYHALIEARIPFEMVHDGLLDAAHIDQFKVLVLPNIAALSDAQCRQLREYVARGGSLVATFETSLYDERGARRKDFGLADLFGATFNGRVEERMQNSYLRIDDPKHPLLKGLEDAERIINGVQRVDAKPSSPLAAKPLTLIPSYPDLPMEEVYPRIAKTDSPEVYLREHGKGRVVYFPWDIDRTFWEVMAPDHGKLLANAVDWAANEPRFVEVHGQGLLDVTVWEQAGSLTVHLVNLTNPMAMKGPYRELIPVGEQRVTLRTGNRKAKGVKLLSGAQATTMRRDTVAMTVIVPSVLDHEVIAIDWED